jgi:dipeptidyl aminopeptidase/acylaminoacyl peptidase
MARAIFKLTFSPLSEEFPHVQTNIKYLLLPRYGMIHMIPLSSLRMSTKSDPRFDYDAEEDPNIQEAGEEVFDGIAVHDISYHGVGRTINAYLVTPIVGHSFPGVLFVHPAPGSRNTFLEEAMKLAERRICSIVVDAPWSAGMEWGKTMGDPEHDMREFIEVVKDLRKAFDVLLSGSIVDPERLGFVGQSLGALCGAICQGSTEG